MDGFTPRSPVEPPFGCSAITGLRPAGEATDRIAARLADRFPADHLPPRFVADGDMVVSTAGRRMTVATAKRVSFRLFRSAFTIEHDGLAASDLRSLRDLVLAIRQAQQNDPLPPAIAMRSAA